MTSWARPMGADGGVLVMHLRRGASLEELRELLAPWWEELTYLGSRGGGLRSRTEWITDYLTRAADGERCVFGAYGTDLGDQVQWGELRDWMEDLEDALSDPARSLGVGGTFADYAEEAATRPDDAIISWRSDSRWEELLLSGMTDRLRPMLIQEWRDRLEGILWGLDPERRETWT